MYTNWNLKEIRKINGLSQEEVARILGKSRSTVAMLETGGRSISADELFKLANYLGMDVMELINPVSPDSKKYREMLIETLRRYQKYTGRLAPKTLLAKLIYFADFAWYYDELKPMSGMRYRRDQYGPVPDLFFRMTDNMIESGELDLEIRAVPGRKARAQLLGLSEDLIGLPNQYLTEREIDMIDKIVHKWKDATVDEIVDFTHHQLPWQVTRPGEFIPYELITQEEPENVY